MLTPDLLRAAVIHMPMTVGLEYVTQLNSAMAEIAVNTPERVALFVAQNAYESSYFSCFEENLNYSAARLIEVYPKHYDTALAAQHAHKPETIANHVYANRLGNGNEASGDGWKYRGRGSIMDTGKANYQRLMDVTSVDVITRPELVAQPAMAFKAGALFWSDHNLNDYGDMRDIAGSTRVINGGYNGLADRTKLYAACCKAFGVM